MGTSTKSGDIGEALVVAEAAKRGLNPSLPLSNDLRYDMIIDRDGVLEKVQVKTTSPKDGKLSPKLDMTVYASAGVSNNRNQTVKYQLGDFDWLVVVDSDSEKCYYVPANEVIGKSSFSLRLEATKNGQSKKVRYASDYEKW